MVPLVRAVGAGRDAFRPDVNDWRRFSDRRVAADAVRAALGVGITLLIVVFTLPTLIGGVGLLRGKPWARRFGLFIAALNLVYFPIGTPVGAYGLWVLS